MDIEHECLACGRTFVGRPNKRFCSDRCKQTEKYLRRRLRLLRHRFDHHRAQAEVEQRSGNARKERYYSWLCSEISDEIRQIEIQVGKPV